jgi:uncharacterized protein (DUF433 family)
VLGQGWGLTAPPGRRRSKNLLSQTAFLAVTRTGSAELSRSVDVTAQRDDILGRGVYGTADAVRLVNFRRPDADAHKPVSARTIVRWLGGYDYEVDGERRHANPLWRPDYAPRNGAEKLTELSFRDLIELRFVKTFRDQGLSLRTIRECLGRAVEAVRDERPFSTRRFRTDGKTIFLEITDDVSEGELLDLKQRQNAFRRIVAPSLRDLEFDADVVARWFPLGVSRKSIVVDPARAFGRPIVAARGVPTEVLTEAIKIEGSPERVAALYEVSLPAVRDALEFQRQLAA